ncbi:CobW family GTP-binding protein [Solitalea lacus]|uniref:CobW family GTP-binding protein n=1 Tax=Solitalea lacus TaxID=2911172 RepID=UPI001EDAAD6D|nr:GTP-binding protein [Solitalea lacus]UKJ06652.1 GTP-binding protein [Solitalea lacus]
MQYPVPVTILTGFLGAGKTSLLNQLIKQNMDKKLVVLENEFGDVSIDSELVFKGNNELFEISNGCICCSMSGEFNEVLAKLIQEIPVFDHLVVESTGIADPSSVAAAFVGDQIIQSHFKLDGVICLVDAQNVLSQLKEREEVRKQLAFSDVIVVNKVDLIDAEELMTVVATIKKINPYASLVNSLHGEQEELNLLSLSAYSPKKVEQGFRFFPMGMQIKHEEVVSQSFVFDQPLDLLKFRHWLNVLLVIQGQSFYRVKGVLNFAGLDERHIVQSVMNNASYTLGSDWEEGMVRTSKIVFIGKNLRRDLLEKGLKNCYADFSFV